MKKALGIILICGLCGLPGLLALAGGLFITLVGLSSNEFQLKLDTGLEKAAVIQWGFLAIFIGVILATATIFLLVRILRKKS